MQYCRGSSRGSHLKSYDQDDQGVDKSADRYKAVPRTLCFITHGDEVLLLRGAHTKRIWPDKYNGVGGHVEADEDIYTSAMREMCEETGLDVADVRLRGILNIDVVKKRASSYSCSPHVH